MNPIWFSGPGWAAVLNALINTLWQGALASAVLVAALRMIPARCAGLRYCVSAAALASVVLLGVGGWAWRAAPVERAGKPVILAQPRFSDAAPARLEVPTADVAPAPGIGWAQWAGCAWLAGVLICLVRAARGVIGAGRLRSGCRELADPRLVALAAELCAKLRISRPVQILVSADISMPSVMGVFGAAILIPASMLTGISADQWRAILAHELAHVRRWDYLVNLGQMLVEALLFFNPFVWWISRQMRLEREACCDQLAAALCQSPARYVAALVSVIEHRQAAGSPVLAAGGESGRDALDRARRLLAPGYYTPALRLRWFSFAGVCALGILALSALGLGARAVAEALTPQERIAEIARLQAGYAPPVYPEDKKFQIKGIVRQEDGAPLTGRATLYVYSMRQGSSEIADFPIDPAGTFSVSTPCGQIRLAVYADGCAPVFLGPFDTNKGQPANLVIPMQRGFAGNIHTVDEAGQPVPGVRLSWTYLSMPGGPANQETTSDAAGLATLPHASAVPLDMRAWADGYQADEVQNLRLDPAKPYTWTLRKAQPLHGQITSAAAGAPIAGATIKLAAIFGRAQIVYGYPGDAPLLATSDARGEFTLDTLPKGGNCWLYVEAAGYGNVVVKSVQPSTETLRIALGPELTVSGTVANLKPGETTLWYSQSFQIGDCNYSQRQSTVALKPDESGKASFNLRQLYAAPLTITAGPLADPQIVKIEPEDLPKSGLRIDLAGTEAKAPAPAPTREVVLHFKTPEGSPPASGSVQVLSTSGVITLPQDHTGKSIPSAQPEVPVENGVAKFEVQTPTTLTLGPSRLIGYAIDAPAPLAVAAGDSPQTIDVDAQPAGAIYGEAVEADGSPGAGLLIFARTFKHPHDPGYIVGADIKNQSWGPNDLQNQFVATGLPFGGEYVIQVQRDDLNVSSEPVRIDASDPIQHVKLVVPAGHSLTVHLFDENGAPAAGVAFRLRYLASPDNRSDGPIHWSDSEGLCTIPSVNLAALDRYSVRVESRSRYQPAMTPCAPGQSSVDVHLKTGKTLTGTVVDAASFRPVAGVEVYAWSAGDPSKTGPPAFAVFEAEAPTDERGRFKFSDLPDYNVYLNTRQANLADPRTRPEAKSGQSDPVELRVKLLQGSEARIVTPGIPEVVP